MADGHLHRVLWEATTQTHWPSQVLCPVAGHPASVLCRTRFSRVKWSFKFPLLLPFVCTPCSLFFMGTVSPCSCAFVLGCPSLPLELPRPSLRTSQPNRPIFWRLEHFVHTGVFNLALCICVSLNPQGQGLCPINFLMSMPSPQHSSHSSVHPGALVGKSLNWDRTV